MKRYFNTEGQCKPNVHYMVNLDQRVKKIKEQYIDRGSYFVINRGRQYGKTTTLRALAAYLKKEYIVLPLDFQKMSTVNFKEEHTFVIAFIEQITTLFADEKSLMEDIDSGILQKLTSLKNNEQITLNTLFLCLSKLCETAKKPVVLMIDEVDSAANNQVFLDFLAMLRGYYLDRDNKAIFQSVILAGVYDIKNLKLKLRPDEEHKYNSPWNISADFDIKMSFSANTIAGMLREYELDNKTGMNIELISKEIFQYTSGYPYLVSLICKLLDEKVPDLEVFEDCDTVWTKEGIIEAVKILLKKTVPLFGSMVRQLDNFSDLRSILEDIIYQGKQIPYSPDVKSINMGVMFGFLKEENDHVAIANRIFEMRLLNMFIAEEAVKSESYQYGQRDRSQFVCNGRLNMDLVLEKFVVHFHDIYGSHTEKFVEEYGRKFFLLYLKPIINGIGNYYLEAQTRDARRTDVIVDYHGEQFIVELKIWHGNEYNERGEAQLADYLNYYHQNKGYMLSFNFNKKKETGMKEIRIGDKVIVEAVV